MDEVYLGQIMKFSFVFAPQTWMECAGQTLNIATYQSLYTLLETRFGGNGTTTFCLPDLREAALYSQGLVKYYIAMQGTYPSRG